MIPQVGAHESIQDRQSDFQGHRTNGRLDGVSSTLGILTQVESVRPSVGDCDTKSVFQSTPDQSGDEDIARVPEIVIVEDVLEDVRSPEPRKRLSSVLDSVDLMVMFKGKRDEIPTEVSARCIQVRHTCGFARVGSWGSCPERSTEALVQTTARRVGGEEQNGGEVQVLQ